MMWNLLRRLKRRLFPAPAAKFWRNRELIVRPGGWRKLFLPLYVHANQKILDRYNACIPCLEEISPFATPHGMAGIFISYGASMGPDCTVFQQVTIGSNNLADSRGRGAPVIGKNVYIGAGAKIIGGVTVGDNVRIGANCAVTFDVPDNATVVLSAPRVILHEEPRDNAFVTWEDRQREEPRQSYIKEGERPYART